MATNSLKAGVVTGKAYFELVDACKSGGYALPAVNITSSSTANAALEAAAKANSDIIIQMSNGGAAFWGGPSITDSHIARVKGGVSACQHIHLMAEHYGVAVVLHTDHANRKFLPWIDDLLNHGEAYYKANGHPLFSSHMLDLSEEDLKDNIETCAIYLERMAKIDMSIEIELGITGGEEDGVGHDLEEDANTDHLYTQPDDVLAAYDLLTPIGHFSVAASFGNVHGVYKPGNVELRPEILKHSQALVQNTHNLANNPLHLVFHGGSGSEKAKIAEALTYGVFKMNIDTDTQFAYSAPAGQYIHTHNQAFKHQIDPKDGTPYKKFYDPRKWVRACEVGLADRLVEAFKDLESLGKSVVR